jgi:hypothetical protein
MSTFLYKCPVHGEFEVEHSIKEKLEECPLCKEKGKDPPEKIVRLISSGTTFILAGSRWASTGYS